MDGGGSGGGGRWWRRSWFWLWLVVVVVGGSEEQWAFLVSLQRWSLPIGISMDVTILRGQASCLNVFLN
jgi:hypothetical protein